jgi:DNA-binding MarR family transcriptional regulator
MTEIEPGDRLLTSIRLAEQATQALKESAVNGAGITRAQYNALLMLSAMPATTAAELARRCQVTPQSMNETIRRLERDGLIARSPNRAHRHVTELLLTRSGRARLRHADAAVIQVEKAIREVLSAREIAALQDVLARVCSVAEQGAQPGTETNERAL